MDTLDKRQEGKIGEYDKESKKFLKKGIDFDFELNELFSKYDEVKKLSIDRTSLTILVGKNNNTKYEIIKYEYFYGISYNDYIGMKKNKDCKGKIFVNDFKIESSDDIKDLNLENSIFLDKFTISPRFIDSELILRNSFFFKEVSMKNITFNSKVDFFNSIFLKNVNLIFSSFNARADFFDTLFYEYLNLKNTEFNQELDLRFKINEFNTNFRMNIIGSYLSRNSAKINKNFSFKNAIILDDSEKERDLSAMYTKENLLAFRNFYKQIYLLDKENEFHYWYNKYTQKEKLKVIAQKKIDIHDHRSDGFEYITYEPKAVVRFIKKSILFTNALTHIVFLDWVSGYFTKIWKMLGTILLTIIVFGLIYCLPDIVHSGTGKMNIEYIIEKIYLSGITFVTVGFGDVVPCKSMRLLSVLEGILGIILTSVFITTFAKKNIG